MEALAGQLLRLLAEDAAPEVIRGTEQQHLDASGGASRAEVRTQVDLALHLRQRLDRYKRRAAELAALYDTAGDLSAMRDVERVLQAIVRRSRSLLGAEVAYLMLIDDERGDAFMRVTEGTSTAGFMGIRLPLGVGLGGLVAETATAHWTSEYVEDSRYLHAVDGAVDAERLTAILGVPLRLGHRVLGVLFAADRHPRAWAQEDVSLLSSLAAHAAICLENASLFQETREGMARLEQVKQVVEQHNAVLERASEMHERLTLLVLRGGDLRGLAEAVCDVLGGVLFVTDVDGRVVASAAGPGAHEVPVPVQRAVVKGAVVQQDRLPVTVLSLLEEAVRTRSTLRAQTELQATSHVAPVVAADACLGALVFSGPPMSAPDVRALERAATVTALLLLNQRARDEAENRVRGELLAELLSSRDPDLPALMRRASLLGVDLSQDCSVLVCSAVSAAVGARLRADAAAFVTFERGLLTWKGEDVVLLLPGQDPSDAACRTADRLGAGGGEQVTIGAAGPVWDLRLLSTYVREAERCVKALGLLGRAGQWATAADLGMYSLLVGEAGEDLAHGFVRQTLGDLVQYDAARGTSLLDTVEQYLSHNGNAAQAAQSLHIHANTLYQRLERVDRLLGPDWRAGDRSLDLRLALKMRHLVL